MSILYPSGKAKVVTDGFNMLSMGSTTHVEVEERDLGKDVHRLACLGVILLDSTEGEIVLSN